jgi:hypothetical protein
MRKSKYNVTNAPRHIRLKWLKKAQRARKYYAGCRKRMGSRLAAKTSIFHPTPIAPPIARSIDETEDWVPHSNPGGLVNQVRPGSLVTVVNRFGQLRKGRAVMRSSSGGWVLNMGGRYGTPEIADDNNITKVSGGRRAQARNPELLVVSNPGDRRNASMRRRRRRNSWRGNRPGHRKAALKGWRKRRHGRRKGSRRSTRRKGRKSRGRRSKHFRTYRAACKALGIGRAAARAWKQSKYNKK